MFWEWYGHSLQRQENSDACFLGVYAKELQQENNHPHTARATLICTEI